MVGNLYVSNLTSESFSISWNGTDGQLDGYILEVIDSSWLSEPEEHNISHNAMSHDLTGLRPSTDYIAYLYGIVKGSRTKAVSTVASTGILSLVFNLFTSGSGCVILPHQIILLIAFFATERERHDPLVS